MAITNAEKIRLFAIQKRIQHYKIAEKMHISESNFSKMLRKNNITDEKCDEIIKIIDEIANDRS